MLGQLSVHGVKTIAVSPRDTFRRPNTMTDFDVVHIYLTTEDESQIKIDCFMRPEATTPSGCPAALAEDDEEVDLADLNK